MTGSRISVSVLEDFALSFYFFASGKALAWTLQQFNALFLTIGFLLSKVIPEYKDVDHFERPNHRCDMHRHPRKNSMQINLPEFQPGSPT